MSVGSWLKRKRSYWYLRRAEKRSLFRFKLAKNPGSLVDEDLIYFATDFYRNNESQFLPKLCDALGDRGVLIEPVLWRKAKDHKGGRIWRDLLWDNANRASWSEAQWIDFAVLCGATGELSLDVAKDAGIPISECNAWWGPPFRSNICSPLDTSAEENDALLGIADTYYDTSVYLEEVKSVLMIGIENLSLSRQEEFAEMMFRHGSHCILHHLLCTCNGDNELQLLEKSEGGEAIEEIRSIRRTLGLPFKEWLEQHSDKWAEIEGLESGVELLEDLPDVLAEDDLKLMRFEKKLYSRMKIVFCKQSGKASKSDLIQEIRKLWTQHLCTLNMRLYQLCAIHLEQRAVDDNTPSTA
jgi:hypothetical protein